MKRIHHYLFHILLAMCIHPSLNAQSTNEYDPGTPPEPEILFSLTLQMNHSSAGYTSGQGNYPVGRSVRVIAYAYSGYQFEAWIAGDSVISTARDFYFEMPARHVTLTARYLYDPSQPSEPNYTYTLKLLSSPSGAGYFSNDNRFYLPGTLYQVYAYPYSGYIFKGWYRNDSLVSNSTPYGYTTRTYNDTLVARFEYQPSNPGEPATGTGAAYNISLLTPSTEKGRTLAFPVHMLNRNTTIYETNFDLVFPAGAIVDRNSATLSGRKDGHDLLIEQLNDSTYRIAVTSTDNTPLTGESGILMTLPLTIPQEWEENRTYAVKIANATVRIPAGTVTCPAKSGGIRILSEDAGLYASFYPDIYLNRAHFVNLSSPLADSFHWDFGDGHTSTEKNPLHSYSEGGNYTVKLLASKGTLQDSAQFNIVITQKNHWRISGNFTLDNTKTDVRNFQSAVELFTLFSQANIAGSSWVNTASGQLHQVNMSQLMYEMLQTLRNKLKASQQTISFSTTDSTLQPTIDYRNGIDQPALDMLIELWKQLPSNKVKYAIEGVVLNSTAINSFSSQTICSESTTNLINFSVINPELTYYWYRVGNPLTLSGHLSEGEHTLPAMTLINSSTTPDTVMYEVRTTIPNTSFTKLLTLHIAVLPRLITVPEQVNPASGSEQASTNIHFSWTGVANAVYDLYIWEKGNNAPESPSFSSITSTSFSNSSFCRYGKEYNWKVTARGTCNSTTSTTSSFSVRTLPDLEVVSIQHPTEMYPGDEVTVLVTIKNKGGKTPPNSYWRDDLALSRNANLEGILSLTSVAAYRTLLPDSSYSVSMKFILPLDTIPYSRFVVRCDYHNHLLESNETNNVFVSDPIHIIQPRIDSLDYELLKALHRETNGNNWTRKWNITSDVVVSTNWPGVNFQRGRVTAINLNNNNLVGEMPLSFVKFAQLKRLELHNNKLTGDLNALSDSLIQMNEKCDSLSYLNLSNNKFVGEIAAFAHQFPLLSYVNLSGNQQLWLKEAISPVITQLNLQYQNVEIQPMNMTAYPVFDSLPAICRYNHAQQQFNAWPGFSILHQNSTVGYITYYNNRYNLSWNNTTGWRLPSGVELELMQHSGIAYGTRSPFKLFYIQGDANSDQEVNILDVQHTLNFLLRNSPALFNFAAANTYPDDQITVQDLVRTVEMILENDSTLQPEEINAQRMAGISTPNQVYIQGNQLMISSVVPVAALDIRVDGLGIDGYTNSLDNNHFHFMSGNTNNNGMRLIVFSPDGQELSAGTHTLGYFTDGNPAISKLLLSDRYATPIPFRIGTTLTGDANLLMNGLEINCTSNVLKLFTKEPMEQVEIRIYNMHGAIQFSNYLPLLAFGETEIKLQTELHTGIYLLQVQSNKSSSLHRQHFKIFISK
jgi:PKD repeat protein